MKKSTGFPVHFEPREVLSIDDGVPEKFPSGMGGETPEGGDICIHIANSLCFIAETNITL